MTFFNSIACLIENRWQGHELKGMKGMPDICEHKQL